MIIQGHKVTLINPKRDHEWLKEFEAKAKNAHNFWWERSLLEVVMQPGSVFFAIEDKGIIGAMNIKQGLMADAHMTFVERPSKDIISLCSELADIVIACADLQILITAIPSHRGGLIKFTKKVGFIPIEKTNGILLLAKLRKEPD